MNCSLKLGKFVSQPFFAASNLISDWFPKTKPKDGFEVPKNPNFSVYPGNTLPLFSE